MPRPSKAVKAPALHVTGYAGNDPWLEWSHCYAAATNVRHMPGERVCTVVLSRCGQELARKTEALSRGRVVGVYLSFVPARQKCRR